jgi:V/A-type H+-transporting ATPase subunit E
MTSYYFFFNPKKRFVCIFNEKMSILDSNFCDRMCLIMSLETAENKIQEICEKIRKDTLDPARVEAHLMIESAEKRAEQIVEEAKREAESSRAETKKDFQNQLSVHEVGLDLAVKQAVSKLKQEVMKIFHKELGRLVTKEVQEPHVIAKMLTALLGALEKDGIKGDINVLLPKILSVEALFENLTGEIKKKLEKETIAIGDFAGGIALKLLDHKIMIDMSDKALKELLVSYASEELKEKIFNV